jgi:hypothetical protein
VEYVAICGGGNIAHSLAAVLSRQLPVRVVTRKPERWSDTLLCEQAGLTWQSKYPISATANIDDVADACVAFVALPQFAVKEVVDKLCSSLKPGTTVAFIPAPAKSEEYSKQLIARGMNVVGFQRVPFISRISEYGHSVSISAPRSIHKLALSDNCMSDEWQRICRNWLGGEVVFLSSFISFTFSNSNPLLHPSRLMVLLRQPSYKYKPLFYAEWTDESSELYVKSDSEMLSVMQQCPGIEVNRDYEPVLAHYGVDSINSLTRKIRSIPAFKKIEAPYRLSDDGLYVPDTVSRYFTEDVEYGTKSIKELALRFGIETPTIDMFVERIDALLSGNAS